MRSDARNFALERADVERRVGSFMGVSEARAAAIVERYEAATFGATPTEILVLARSDYMFKRPTYAIGALQARAARAPVFAYHFEWETPVEDGRMRSPHTSEIPFIFGTAAAARACVGTGSEGLMRVMMASWAAFARSGNPANDWLPDWPRFDPVHRQTMCLDTESHLAPDPGGEARRALDGLPFYTYGQSVAPIVSG